VRVLNPSLRGVGGDRQKVFVVAFDPGVTTGWAVFRADAETLFSEGFTAVARANPDPEVFAWNAGYFSGPEPYQAEQMMALTRGTWMHGGGVFDEYEESDYFFVVLERFKLLIMGDDETLLSPVRLAAMYRALSWRGPFPVVTQSTGDAFTVTTDERLRKLNLWSGVTAKIGEHQRDASKHAVLALRKFADPRWRAGVISMMPWLKVEETE